MDDCDLLLDYARHNSSRAFTALVERHVDLVYSAALRRVGGDHHRAAEVTQQVFTDLARKAGEVARHPVLVGWLHRSTQWAAASLRRGEQRRLAREQAAALDMQITASTTDDRSRDWEMARAWLDQALDQLTPEDRDAVLLRYFSNLSHAEIGRRLGVSENAARMRIDRALERLHDGLKRHGITSTAAALGLALSQHAIGAAPAGLAATVSTTALGAATAATVSAGATNGLTLLMSKFQLVLVFGVAAVLATALHRRWEQRDAQRRQLAAAQQEHRDLQLELQQLTARLAAQKVEQARAAAATPAPEPLTPAQQERLRLDLIVRRGALDGDYATLFRRLKLDGPTLDRLKTLIVQRDQAEFDALQPARDEQLVLSSAEERSLKSAATQDIDTAVAALLGPDRMALFARYVATLPLRNGFLPSSLANDDARQEQAEAVLRLFDQTAPSYVDDCNAAGEIQTLPAEFLEKAKPYLTPAELRQFEFQQQRIAVVHQMNEIARIAAYAGKLKLSKNSAKWYATPPATSAPVTKP